MDKTIEQLRQEYADNERELEQAQHQLNRIESRISYYEKGERQKRAHRLITRGAAIESLAPEIKALSEAEFYSLADCILSLPQVQELLRHATAKNGES